jgi:GntR family transcriptional regulator
MPAMPVFRRIMSDIRTQIETGNLPPGTKLPSTKELASQYECSEEPVKKALGRLEDAGLIFGHQGRGRYVQRAPV